KAGMHGEMHYMEENFDKRINPKKLMPECRSIVSVIANYYTLTKNETPKHRQEHNGAVPENEAHKEEKTQRDKPEFVRGRLSIYATRTDYHVILKQKLLELFDYITELVGEVNGRAFVDSAPMLDKAWAARAGLGWIGKHTNLINREIGSYFFIGSLLLDCRLDVDAPLSKNYCGTCTACIDLCPTKAIVAPYQVDARKCISYLTIELKRNFTEEEKAMLGEWLFGCDICQEVCPWTRFSKPTQLLEFAPKPELEALSERDILEMTKSSFRRIFGETPVFRTGLRRLKRNAAAVQENLSGVKISENTATQP
ncbi:MAG: tRNA epoxyqueuosine(34) reductase QueG, partial [Candidatus Thermochlorobacter sp.]